MDIAGSGLVTLAQGQQHIGIARAHRCRGAIGQSQSVGGQPDVVDQRVDFTCGDGLADHGLDCIAQRSGFFDAQTAGCA